MGRSTMPPQGADVLYSRFDVEWDPDDGLVHIEAGSGEFTQAGVTTLRAAMKLHHKLGVAIDRALRRGQVVPAERRAEES